MQLEALQQSNCYNSNFVRLGKRDYVQGSTLVQGLLEAIQQWRLGPLNHLQVSCHTMLNEQGYYELLNTDEPELQQRIRQAATVFHINCEHINYIVLLHGINKPVTNAVPYDEDALISTSILNEAEKKISMHWEINNSLMKVLIALNKSLLTQILPSNKHGKWIFYKCDLSWDKLHNVEGTLTLQLKTNIGLQSALSNIYLNNELLGNIFFTRPIL